jgi:hypothetical protein
MKLVSFGQFTGGMSLMISAGKPAELRGLTLIRGKRPSSIAVALLTVTALVTLVAFIVSVIAVLTSAEYIMAAVCGSSPNDREPSDWYELSRYPT